MPIPDEVLPIEKNVTVTAYAGQMKNLCERVTKSANQRLRLNLERTTATEAEKGLIDFELEEIWRELDEDEKK